MDSKAQPSSSQAVAPSAEPSESSVEGYLNSSLQDHVATESAAMPLATPSTSSAAAPRVEPKFSRKVTKSRPLSDLKPDSLHIVLFSRWPIEPNSFHWGLYLHQNELSGGKKFHVDGRQISRKFHVDGRQGRWKIDHGTTREALTSSMLIGLVRIADVPVDQMDAVAKWITAEDAMINEIEGFRCRLYVEMACVRLKAQGYVRFTSWEVLQRDMEGFGNRYANEAEQNVQPRPIAVALKCDLTPSGDEKPI
ncbi:hypothetical protein MMC26_003502 [Xylographa opegraphella]|nr:hypothetical protein [Xylographa opegraphella]